jgi:hypothetical protein
MTSQCLSALPANDAWAEQRSGVRTSPNSPRLLTDVVISGFAPAIAGAAWPNRFFHGAHLQRGKVEAIGAEVMEIVYGKIKEIRDHHRPVPAETA